MVCAALIMLLVLLGASAVVQAAKPEDNPATRAQGQLIFDRTCHGVEGRGDGPVTQAGELTDALGLWIQAVDLTRPSSFKNGAALPDLVRTLLTGLDGTPMPSYAARLSDRDSDAWDLAQYLRALSAESGP